MWKELLAVRVINGVGELASLVGQELGTSAWLEIGQERVNEFAHATGDEQWIHVDPERAKGGPFGTTIAHGYLTLALLPVLQKQAYQLAGTRMSVNYGLDRVRFMAPVPVSSRVRARCALAAIEERGDAVQATYELTVEIEGSDKPACVARSILRHYV
jgi:acyl dehydratase